MRYPTQVYFLKSFLRNPFAALGRPPFRATSNFQKLPQSLRTFSHTTAKKAAKDDDSSSKDSSQSKETISRPEDFAPEKKEFIIFKILNKLPLNIHEAMWAEDYVRKCEEEAGKEREQDASATRTSQERGKGPNPRPGGSRATKGHWISGKDQMEDLQQWNEHAYKVLSEAKDQGESASTEALIGLVYEAIDRSHGPLEKAEREELFQIFWEMLRRDIEKGKVTRKAKTMAKKAGNID